MGKLTISMAIFNSKLLVYQRVWLVLILSETDKKHDLLCPGMRKNSNAVSAAKAEVHGENHG